VYRAAECRTEDSFAAHITALESELGASLPNIRHHKTGGQRWVQPVSTNGRARLAATLAPTLLQERSK
jgi:hypothetical protein